MDFQSIQQIEDYSIQLDMLQIFQLKIGLVEFDLQDHFQEKPKIQSKGFVQLKIPKSVRSFDPKKREKSGSEPKDGRQKAGGGDWVLGWFSTVGDNINGNHEVEAMARRGQCTWHDTRVG